MLASKPVKPPRAKLPRSAVMPPKQPDRVEIGQQVNLQFQDNTLILLVPLRVNGTEVTMTLALPMRQIPEDLWRNMQAARSGIALIAPSAPSPIQH